MLLRTPCACSGGTSSASPGGGGDEALWDSRVGGLTNGPITYELDERQYVVAGVGVGIASFLLNQ